MYRLKRIFKLRIIHELSNTIFVCGRKQVWIKIKMRRCVLNVKRNNKWQWAWNIFVSFCLKFYVLEIVTIIVSYQLHAAIKIKSFSDVMKRVAYKGE